MNWETTKIFRSGGYQVIKASSVIRKPMRQVMRGSKTQMHVPEPAVGVSITLYRREVEQWLQKT